MRNVFKRIFNNIEISDMCMNNMPVAISFDNFKKCGLSDSRSYRTQVARNWGQCDFIFKQNNEIKLYAEIKTTTSSLGNTCHLINVAITALRKFDTPLFNIIMYPDKAPNKLRMDYDKYSAELYRNKIISQREKELLDDNLYILTHQTFDTSSGIKGKLKKLNIQNLQDYKGTQDIIEKLKLLDEGSFNYSEWHRLINDIKKCLN